MNKVTEYFLTLEGSVRIGLAVGTPLVRSSAADVYRVLSPGESFFKVRFGSNTDIGLSLMDWTTTNPVKATYGKYFANNEVVIGFDTIPGDRKYIASSTLSANVVQLHLCLEPNHGMSDVKLSRLARLEMTRLCARYFIDPDYTNLTLKINDI